MNLGAALALAAMIGVVLAIPVTIVVYWREILDWGNATINGRHRIRYVEGVGFIPEFYRSGWVVLDKCARETRALEHLLDRIEYSSFVHENEESAGQVINKHSAPLRPKTVWQK